jgi:hypothetical protein
VKLPAGRWKRSWIGITGVSVPGPAEGELVELLEQDGLDAADVDELEGEGPAAGLVHAGPPVLGAEAEELLGLAELGPGDGPGEERLHEAPEIGPRDRAWRIIRSGSRRV